MLGNLAPIHLLIFGLVVGLIIVGVIAYFVSRASKKPSAEDELQRAYNEGVRQAELQRAYEAGLNAGQQQGDQRSTL